MYMKIYLGDDVREVAHVRLVAVAIHLSVAPTRTEVRIQYGLKTVLDTTQSTDPHSHEKRKKNTPWRISTMGRVRRLARVSSKCRRRRACRPSSPFSALLVAVGAGPWAGRVSAYLVLFWDWWVMHIGC